MNTAHVEKIVLKRIEEYECELVEELLQKFNEIGIDTSKWEYEFGDGNTFSEFIQLGIKSHLETFTEGESKGMQERNEAEASKNVKNLRVMIAATIERTLVNDFGINVYWEREAGEYRITNEIVTAISHKVYKKVIPFLATASDPAQSTKEATPEAVELLEVPAIKTGRCFNGFERDRGKIIHLVKPLPEGSTGDWFTPAICGAQPGRRGNGWGLHIGPATCPKCLFLSQQKTEKGKV